MSNKKIDRTISSFVNDNELEGNTSNMQHREKQIRRDNDSFPDTSVSLYDIDFAILSFINNTIQPNVSQDGKKIPVPVKFVSGEKWNDMKIYGFLKDKNDKLLPPLITIKRNSISLVDSLRKNYVAKENLIDVSSKFSKVSRYDKYSVLQGQRPKKEIYKIEVPDYIDVDYDIRIWCDQQIQVNQIAELMIYYKGQAFGDENSYKFLSMTDSMSFDTDSSIDNDRIVSANFTLKTQAYLIPKEIGNRNNLRKSISVGKIKINTHVSDNFNSINRNTNSLELDESISPYSSDSGADFRSSNPGSTGLPGNISFGKITVKELSGDFVTIPALTRNDSFTMDAIGFQISASIGQRKITIINDNSLILPSGVISGSQQIVNLGFNISSSEQILLNNSLFSSSNQVDYNSIQNIPNDIISSSNQIFGLGYTISSSEQILNNNDLVSSSEQIESFGFITESILPDNLISSSAQITNFGFISESYSTSGTGIVSSSNQVEEFGYTISSSEQILLNNSLFSSSNQVDYDSIQNVPNDLVSSSNQINLLGYTISSSEQILLNNDLISSSEQIESLGFITESITELPDNLISSSAQITNYGFISESYSTSGTGIVSSSEQVEGLGFNISSSEQILLDNKLFSSSNQVDYDLIQNVPNNIVSSSEQIESLGFITESITELPDNLVSSSAQITNFGFISESYSTSGTNIVSSSIQITNFGFTISSSEQILLDNDLISSSIQIEELGFNISSSEQILLNNNLVSASNQINYNSIQNIPNNLISSSNQIFGLGYTISSSEQILINNDLLSSSEQIAVFGYYKSSSNLDINDLSISGEINIDNITDELTERTPLVIDETGRIYKGSDYTVDTGSGSVDMVAPNSSNLILLTNASGSKEIKQINSNADFNNYGIINLGQIINSNIISSSNQISGLGFNISSSEQILISQSLISSSNQVDYSLIQNIPNNLVSSSNQINLLGYTISSSEQILLGNNLVSSSEQIEALGFITESITELPDNLVSSSEQINYDLIQNIPGDIISSSAQIVNFGFNISSSDQILLDNDLVSSSAQITNYGFISESYSTSGTGIVSSSEQIEALGFITESITELPSGLISGSEQIFGLGYTISSSEQILLNSDLVSSSNQIEAFGFITESILPDNLISSSAQITNFGFISESYSTSGTGIVSSSNQVFGLGYTISSSEQILYSQSLVSSSEQILPITTSFISNFQIGVSQSIVDLNLVQNPISFYNDEVLETNNLTSLIFKGSGFTITEVNDEVEVNFESLYQNSAFELDNNNDLMPTDSLVFSRVNYELDENNDLMPI